MKIPAILCRVVALIVVTRDIANLESVSRDNGRSNWNDTISAIAVEHTSVIDRPGGGGPPHTDPDAAIRKEFGELLDRSPTDAELRTYRQRFLESRWTESDLRADIERSREFRLRQIDAIIFRSYRELLGREPDAGGLESYRQPFLEHGWDEARLRDAIRRSPEYRDRLTPKPVTKPGRKDVKPSDEPDQKPK